MENNNIISKEPIYASIDINIKDRAKLYCVESKLAGLNKTSNLRSLIEESLIEFMKNNPITSNNEKSEK